MKLEEHAKQAEESYIEAAAEEVFIQIKRFVNTEKDPPFGDSYRNSVAFIEGLILGYKANRGK